MSKKLWVLMAACIVIGCSLVDGFTNHIGALMMCIGFGIGCYHDGKDAGSREVFEPLKRK